MSGAIGRRIVVEQDSLFGLRMKQTNSCKARFVGIGEIENSYKLVEELEEDSSELEGIARAR